MLHVKFHEDDIECREVFALDCLNINKFGEMHMHIHSDAYEYSLECS